MPTRLYIHIHPQGKPVRLLHWYRLISDPMDACNAFSGDPLFGPLTEAERAIFESEVNTIQPNACAQQYTTRGTEGPSEPAAIVQHANLGARRILAQGLVTNGHPMPFETISARSAEDRLLPLHLSQYRQQCFVDRRVQPWMAECNR